MHELDQRLLTALRDCGQFPRVLATARLLSWSGEHGAMWLAAGLVGAAVDEERKTAWLRGTAVTFGAHAVSMGIKLVVRRPRPGEAAPLVWTSGRHSFPSSHATAAAAAAVAFGAFSPTGALVLPPLAAAMCVSRMVVGVHYPTDVVAGAALGAITAKLGAPWMSRALAAAGPVSTAFTAGRISAALAAVSGGRAAAVSQAGATVAERAGRLVSRVQEAARTSTAMTTPEAAGDRRQGPGPSVGVGTGLWEGRAATGDEARTWLPTPRPVARVVPRHAGRHTPRSGARHVPRPVLPLVPRPVVGPVLRPVLGLLLGQMGGSVLGPGGTVWSGTSTGPVAARSIGAASGVPRSGSGTAERL